MSQAPQQSTPLPSKPAPATGIPSQRRRQRTSAGLSDIQQLLSQQQPILPYPRGPRNLTIPPNQPLIFPGLPPWPSSVRWIPQPRPPYLDSRGCPTPYDIVYQQQRPIYPCSREQLYQMQVEQRMRTTIRMSPPPPQFSHPSQPIMSALPAPNPISACLNPMLQSRPVLQPQCLQQPHHLVPGQQSIPQPPIQQITTVQPQQQPTPLNSPLSPIEHLSQAQTGTLPPPMPMQPGPVRVISPPVPSPVPSMPLSPSLPPSPSLSCRVQADALKQAQLAQAQPTPPPPPPPPPPQSLLGLPLPHQSLLCVPPSSHPHHLTQQPPIVTLPAQLPEAIVPQPAPLPSVSLVSPVQVTLPPPPPPGVASAPVQQLLPSSQSSCMANLPTSLLDNARPSSRSPPELLKMLDDNEASTDERTDTEPDLRPEDSDDEHPLCIVENEQELPTSSSTDELPTSPPPPKQSSLSPSPSPPSPEVKTRKPHKPASLNLSLLDDGYCSAATSSLGSADEVKSVLPFANFGDFIPLDTCCSEDEEEPENHVPEGLWFIMDY